MGAQATQAVNTTERLASLRALMKAPEHSVNALIVPSEDQHSSEYLAGCDARRAYISGFTGSAGCAIITLDKALMFTDGRYYLQAGKQLDSNWTLMKVGMKDVPTWQEYLEKNLDKGSKIGIDPTVISIKDANSLGDSLKPRGSSLVSLNENLVDKVWAAARPPRPNNPVFTLDTKFSGKPAEEKISDLRKHLAEKEAAAFVLTSLDEVAWLFNLRGSDIDFNPVFFSYAVVTREKAVLFVDAPQLAVGVGVELRPYAAFFEYLRGLAKAEGACAEKPVLLGVTASLAVATTVGRDAIKVVRSPVAEAKAIKNDTELEGFRQCHIRDGAALVRYFAWLKEQLEQGATLNESQVADRLEAYRKENELFVGLSFRTISSTGPNGAIIHYSPDRADCAVVKREQVYLCDSGAQYWDGTTDTTRTYHFGTPTAEERRAFTRVLQGHIAIDTAVFPDGTTGYLLDPFARRALWQDGLDYRHGTGHGVGHFLNVHEGPQAMGTRKAYDDTALKPGMTLSNEPGYYADGKFGIRIENIVLVREAPGVPGFFGFENVTMVPMGKALIQVDLLSPDERMWVDAYHAEVRKKVGPLVRDDARATAWLLRETSPL